MKAIIFDGALTIREDYPLPEPKEKEALIRVTMAGICNTDREIMNGYLGFHGVMGHEFVGIVEGAPEERRDLIGKRVVGEINCGCGTCEYCRKGLEKHCPSRTTLGIQGRDGAFAEFLTLPVSNLHLVPDNISDEEAVFTEPLAAALEISEQIHIKPTDSILVLGDGKLGLLCSLALGLTGARVTLAGKHETKLKIARNQHIDTLDVSTGKQNEEKAYDIVVEATGRADGFEKAMKLTKPGGTIVLKSTVASSSEMNLAPLVIHEITLVGSRCGPFDAAIRALEKRRIDVRPIISGIYKFKDAREAFDRAQAKESLKIIIDFR
ncbi:MAG: alcohol dehydrogenase [Syntrophus sp. (in: bacteria)]|nr:alcohol dehydrogenase [Syntrophus sp. (in: bacteria)]